MADKRGLANWGSYVIEHILEPFVRVAAPLFIVALMVYFIVAGFVEDLLVGVRQFAGALLPLLGITFIVVFATEILDSLLKVPSWVIFFGSFAWGFLVLVAVHNIKGIQSIPVLELILSATLCVLLFTWVESIKKKVLLFYYGVSIGFVLSIVVLGFPLPRG